MQRLIIICLISTLLASVATASSRTTISLDGRWQIADSKSPTEIPAAFIARMTPSGSQTVTIPGNDCTQA